MHFTRTTQLLRVLAVLLLLSAAIIPAAHANLAAVGPVDSANGYPIWYQDTTGLALDSCIVQTQSELDGGWCLVLPGNIPGVPPESFPANFSEEHFYWSAGADAGVGNTRALLVLALEGAFGGGAVAAGDQMVFARIRIVISPLPASGDYTVYTPFGKFSFPGQVAGGRLFFTEDVGLAPGNFTQALNGRIGPFLLASATPGGAEMPPLTAANPTPDIDPAHFGGAFAPTPYPGTGKSYIADPARIGPVTGSPLLSYTVGDGTTRNPNIFRIEGPAGFVSETVNFSLSGRLFEGAIGGQVTVNRASYARSAAGQKVDVYATATPVAQARIPAGPAPASVPTALSYFDAACTPTLDAFGLPGPPYSAPAGAVANQMLAEGTQYFGQSHPATLPLDVCVQSNAVNAAGQTVATFIPVALGDQVFISEALFDPSTQTLSVKATSSDQVVAQSLTVEGIGTINPTTGQLLSNPLLAPPEKVSVLSSGRGLNTLQVNTGAVAGGGTVVLPVAVNDTVTTLEDTATTIAVLANDTNAAGGTVRVTSAPLLGTAVVNADGSISYTPRLNAFGSDTLSYTVTVGTQVSNAASVAITITGVNDPSVANPDSLTAIANLAATLNVTSNDTDPDGAADIVAVANLSAVTPGAGTTGTATAIASGKSVSFTATAAGIYSFTYQARDAAGALSNPTTVTVTVASAETVSITRAEYVVSKSRIRVQGAVSPAAGQSITVVFLNSVGTVLGTAGTVAADALGAWTVDTVVALPTGANRVRATSSNGSVATATLALK
jgi:VCBS repeat-containing protein